MSRPFDLRALRFTARELKTRICFGRAEWEPYNIKVPRRTKVTPPYTDSPSFYCIAPISSRGLPQL